MILLKLNRHLTTNIRPLTLNTPHYHFKPTPQFELYDKYLKNTNTKASIHQFSSFKFEKVVVPRHLQDYEEIKSKLAGQWKGKKLVFDVDSSALIGGKRLTMKSYLEEAVLKGQTTPDPLFCEINPAAQLNIQQLCFDEQVFFLSDPAVVEFLKQKADLPEDEQQALLQQFLASFYEANPHRMIHRLGSVLNVPQPYRELIQLGVLNFNQIYFCGINQFAFRNLLSKAIKLRDVRQLFMLSLKYALVQSYQWRLRNPLPTQQQKGDNKQGVGSSDRLEDRYEIYARELLYLNYYHIIKKIENGELLKRISVITKDKTKNPDQAGRAVKRRRNVGQNKEGQSSGVVLFAHSYSLDSLQDYILIKDLEIFNPVQNKPKISTANLNSPSPGSKVEVKKSSQSDAQKIEKHAILQVMLGNLWNKPYTFNKFPYLSQNYMKLSQADKDQVNQLYQDFVTKYTGAKRVYYQQNIQIFQHQNLANISLDLDKFRVSYDQARKQYQDGMEFIRKKTQQRQKQKQKGEKKKKKTKKDARQDQIKQQTNKKQFVYKQSYEQDPIQLQRLIDQLKTNPSFKPKTETSKQNTPSSSSPLSMGFQQKVAIKNMESETGQKTYQTEGQQKRGRSVVRKKTAQTETAGEQKQN